MPETRQELEARLQAASDSMARRLNAMESEVKLPAVKRLGRAVRSKRGRKIGMAIGVGLVVGIAAGGLGRGARKRNSNGAWKDRMADSLAHYLDEGYSAAEAARRAARSAGPAERTAAPSGGVVASLVTYVLRQGADIALRELVNHFTSRNGDVPNR